MITTASPPRLTGGDEGQALQRRQLLDMERQWLNSWTQADQLAADAKPDGVEAATRKGQAASRESAASSALQGMAAMPAQAQGPAGPPSPAPLQAVDAAPSAALQHESSAAPSTWAAAGGDPGTVTPAQDARQDLAPGGIRAPSPKARPEQVLSPGSAAPRAGATVMPVETLQVTGTAQAASTERMPLMDRTSSAGPAPESTAPASTTALPRTTALQAPTAPAPGAAAPGAMQEGDADASEGTADASGAKHQARTAAAAQAGGESSAQDRQRITLRELDAATVQATLRDAQLTAQASELAARGLHHALMEAGYARVRVIVNGHAAQSGTASRDSSAPDAPDERTAGLRRKT